MTFHHPQRVITGPFLVFAIAALLVGGVAASGAGPADSGAETAPAQVATGAQDEAINYSLIAPDGDPFLVQGDVRETRLDMDPYLFAGEVLFVDVLVENLGEDTASYEAALTMEGEPIDVATGELGPGERTEERLGIIFESPGQATIRVAGHETTVTVRPSDAGLVTDLGLDRGDEETTVEATVLGGPDVTEHTVEIEEGVVEFVREVVYTETVTLDPGETTSVSYTFENGTYEDVTEFHADGQTVMYFPTIDVDVDVDTDVDVDDVVDDVDVDEIVETDIETDLDVDTDADHDADDDGAGFGVALAIVTIGLASGLASRYR